MYYPSSENKGADQLRGYREADLRLCFRLCRLMVFPWGGSYHSVFKDIHVGLLLKTQKKSSTEQSHQAFQRLQMHLNYVKQLAVQPVETKQHLSLYLRKQQFEYHTNWPVHSKKQARNLKCPVLEEEELYYPYSKKVTAQLICIFVVFYLL